MLLAQLHEVEAVVAEHDAGLGVDAEDVLAQLLVQRPALLALRWHVE